MALSGECTGALDLHLAELEPGWHGTGWLRVDKGVAWVLTHRVPTERDGTSGMRAVIVLVRAVVDWLCESPFAAC